MRHRFLLEFCLFIYLDLFICLELTLAFRHPWLKNIFLSQYLFIAILRVKMSRVNKALCAPFSQSHRRGTIWSKLSMFIFWTNIFSLIEIRLIERKKLLKRWQSGSWSSSSSPLSTTIFPRFLCQAGSFYY